TLPRRQLRQRPHHIRKQDSVVQRAFDVGKQDRRLLFGGADVVPLTGYSAPPKEAGPLSIQKTVDGDSLNPGVEGGLVPKLTDCLIGLEPHFLRKFLSILRIVAIVQRK